MLWAIVAGTMRTRALPIVVHQSKTKALGLLVGSLAFVALSAWILSGKPTVMGHARGGLVVLCALTKATGAYHRRSCLIRNRKASSAGSRIVASRAR
jgi:hypothetical protein